MRLIKQWGAVLMVLCLLSLPLWSLGCTPDSAPAPGPEKTSQPDTSPKPDLGSPTAQPATPEAGSTTGGGTTTP
jgi:hypothetical protein